MKASKEQKRQLVEVRKRLIDGLKICGEIPSTVALSALLELTVDTAINICGREHAIDVICQTVNVLMSTKHRKEK